MEASSWLQYWLMAEVAVVIEEEKWHYLLMVVAAVLEEEKWLYW